MKKRFLVLLLCIALLFVFVPFDSTVSVHAEEQTNVTGSVDYGAVVGNTAVFNAYFPVPVSNAPESVSNPWGTECGQLSESNEAKSLVMVITNYYLSDSGLLWYEVKAAPGYTLPEVLRENPWVYQDNAKSPMGESLVIHDSGQNFVFDENGNDVSSVRMGLYDTVKLNCYTTLIGKADYQWQIHIGDEWVDINGEEASSMQVRYALLESALNSEDCAELRCNAKAGSKTILGNTITIYVDRTDIPEDVPPQEEDSEATEQMAVMRAAGRAADGEDLSTHYVTVQFLFENGTQAANSFVAEVPGNVESPINVDFPYVQGYLPYYEDERQDQLSLTKVFSEDELYTVYYLPDLVDYTVDIYFQNVENDNYSFYDSKTYQGLTGSKVPLNTGTFEGMTELLHETPNIAADGSTHIEVYYDRLYYVTRVYLDGGFGIYSVYARYGANLLTHITVPTRPGHTFLGWDERTVDSDNDGVPDSGGDGVADTVQPTVPNKNLAYVALWKEKAAVKVNIVFWGEDANWHEGDSEAEKYNYLNTVPVYVKPDQEFSYSLTGGDYCDLPEHTHNAACGMSCDIEPHTHADGCIGLTCKINPHTHGDGCYENCNHKTHELSCYTTQTLTLASNLTVWSSSRIAFTNLTSSVSSPTNAVVYRYRYESRYDKNTYNFFYFNGTWYYLGDNDNYSDIQLQNNLNDPSNNGYNFANAILKCHDDNCLSCTKEVHTHSDKNGDCYGYACGKLAHTHSDGCYKCGEMAHTHSDQVCRLPQFEGYDPKLWRLVSSETVTVNRDGTSILNVYFEREEFTITFKSKGGGSTLGTITDKWGADILSRFENECKEHTFLWSQKTDGKSPWTSFLSVMPKEHRTYYANTTQSSSTQTATYYGADLNGEYNIVLYTSSIRYDDSLTVSAEEFVEIDGYEFAYGIDGGGQRMNSPGSYGKFGGSVFYYDRQKNYLEFHSGSVIDKTESVVYEAPLSVYKNYTPKLPPEYEAGSHDFAGWYLNPECTGTRVDLSTLTMPKEALALYAKWVPRYHEVRIVLQKKEDGNYGPEDSVLMAGDQKVESIKVLHGQYVFGGDQAKEPPIPDNGQYKFLGWFFMDNGSELMWEFDGRPVVEDIVIYAKWSSEVMVPYTVYYKYREEGKEAVDIAPPMSSSSLAGHSVTVDAKIGNELDEDYRDGYYPEIVSHSIPLNVEDAENGVEYTFWYKKADSVNYTIHYVCTDEGNTEFAQEEITKSTTLAMVTETYKYFEGYVPDAYQKSLVLSADETKNHIYFYYTKSQNKGVWFIGYYVENKNTAGQYDTHMTDGGVAEVGTKISAEKPVDLSADGFVFSHAVITNVGGTSQEVDSLDEAFGSVTKEGLEIKVYYDRIRYPYKIIYRNKDTGKEILEADIFNTADEMMPYGLTVTVDPVPNIEGYEYASSGTCTIVKDDPENISKNIIYVYYTERRININFEVVGPEGCGTVSPEKLSLRYESDKTATATAAAAKNYKFVGWYYDKACTNPINPTDNLKPNGEMLMLSKGDGWKPVTYYAKFELQISDLTIKRTNAESGQVYVYKVQSKKNPEEVYYATIRGNGEVTIHGLLMGEYTVTQQNDWSWRHSDPEQDVNLQSLDGETVIFGSGFIQKWLNGNSQLEKNVRGEVV